MQNIIRKNIKAFILSVFTMGCFWSGFGQNKIGEEVQKLQRESTFFNPISILTVDSTISKKEINQAVSNTTVAKVKPVALNEIVSSAFDFLELEIPYNDESYKILLYRVDPFAEGFSINTDKENNIAYQKGVFYRGIIKGDLNTVASFNFFNGEFNGIFSSQELGNIVVGKIDKLNNIEDYVIYSDVNFLIQNSFQCHTQEINKTEVTSTLKREATTVKCVTFYYEIDYDLFVSNNSNSQTTANWATSVFNNVQTLFANDGITTALNSVYIWTSLDVYDGVGDASSDYLFAFQEYRPSINSDVGMLIGIDPGGLGGVAFLNGLCSEYNYGYSDVDGISVVTVPTYSWTTSVMTHELGHLMGSPHTHACAWNGNNTPIDGCGSQAGYPETGCSIIGPIPSTTVKGTIMSYCHLIEGVGVSFANGFGIQPATLMVNNINAKPCLSTDCTNCNNTISSIEATSILNTSATLTWEDDESTTSWQISVRPFSATEIWNTVEVPTYQANGLLPNTYYKVKIKPVCTSSTPSIREFVFVTSGNYCGGLNFYDTGGATNSYTDNEYFIRTVTPNLPNKKIAVTFSQFSLESDYDFLYIYDGPDVTYPEFGLGDGFTGTISPGTIVSTAIDGSLTFKFTSDQSYSEAGWMASFSCLENLGINTQDFIDFTYYPNPTTNKITLKSNTVITEIEVYNIQGRKLFTQKLETLESNVDLSQFASGTYFFKVKFQDVEKNFKVLKM